MHATKLRPAAARDLAREPGLPADIKPNYPGAKAYSSAPANVRSTKTVQINRQAAVDYARQYVFDYNPVYERFGNDCANFVSQSMRAGGWGDVGHGEDDPDKWWQYLINDTLPTHSKTWSVSQDLANFGNNYSHRFRFYAGESTRLADVIFADWENGADGHLDHSMIVTSNVPGNVNDWSEIKVSYHTNDTLDAPMSVVAAKAMENSSHGKPISWLFADSTGW
ncbi:amidase domain-containing protein [Amycolatopsis carbonis]|uniref:Amidase domain-containing protein n=1 Tax=Amycolatopsis carbonis TaxID=715471 RepID=A0A9Y2MSR7_9PSEU|nr:amidase domain-containing protein [Amycolatopsis sp. 2-15]WIX76946.1 amidase domain-containing protein [Amycolatopsis sp. 2-15]